jgi:acyl-CoA thioester hydrolase
MPGAIEVHRSSVQTWECDQMGHFNVQFYVDKAMQGLAALAIHLGLPPRELRERGLQLHVGEQHIRFLREQRPGSPFFLRAGVVDAEPSGASLRVFEEMLASVDGAPAASFVGDCRLVDSRSREPLPFPAAVLEHAAGVRVALPDHAGPRGLAPHPPRPRPRLEEAERLAMFRVYEGCVEDAQCDAFGFMTARHYMGAVSSAIPNLLLQILGFDRSQSRIGGAALEYRFVYHSVPRAGDVLTQRSGLAQVGEKAYTFCHWLFDLATGDAVATAEAVAITMDLDARRAIAIPAEMRARLESLVVPGLSL